MMPLNPDMAAAPFARMASMPQVMPAQIGAPNMAGRRPGLFGGLANALRTAGRNYMSIDPQTRMMMGAGMMQGGLPGLAQGMLSGQELLQKREDRAFTLAERERQAAERAQQQQALDAFVASRPQSEQTAARLNPTAAVEAALRRPEPMALPDGFMTDAQGRIVEVPGYFERQRELYNIRFGGRGGGGRSGGSETVDMGSAY